MNPRMSLAANLSVLGTILYIADSAGRTGLSGRLIEDWIEGLFTAMGLAPIM